MHAFAVGDARYGMCFDDFPEDEIHEQQVTVREALHGHPRFVYGYDFGDSLSHTITVEDEIRTPRGIRFAVCLAGENACPTEDSGGSGGHERMLEALAYPNSEEHGIYVQRIGSRHVRSLRLRHRRRQRSPPKYRAATEALGE
jgi:hypothetical protein